MAVEALEHCLEAAGPWMKPNKLRLYPDKTEVLWSENPQCQCLEYHLVPNGVVLLLKKQVSSLGVHLDSQLLLDYQVEAAARGAFAQLHLVNQLWPYLDREDQVRMSLGPCYSNIKTRLL